LHDVRTNFREFSKKRYSSGRWARYFIDRYPELRAIFLGNSSLRRRLSSVIGFSATPLGPLFDLSQNAFNGSLQPVLGRLCWHHLQYRFRSGFRANPSQLSPLAKLKFD
jgi:hypothetical protein